MMVDASAYPRLARYLRSLPNGLLSYPECEGKATMYREAVTKAPKPLGRHGLDRLIVDYLDDPVPTTAWVPEVVNVAVYLALADGVFGSEEGLYAFVGSLSDEIFRSPMYRVLMAVASPERLARAAERRWQHFHTGSGYSIRIGTNGTESHITYPPYLFDRIYMTANTRAIEAGYRASGAKGARVEITSWSPTETVMRSVWDPSRDPGLEG
ncbi:MAG: hypothetical protein U0230_24995 [Polyangiales bacterium]